MATALTHAGVELGLMFVHRRMQLYMEVTNALDLRLSLKAVMSRSAQVSSVTKLLSHISGYLRMVYEHTQ